MFHFSRRTLWVIIFITIPLIAVLNSLGRGETDAVNGTTTNTWSLDTLDVDIFRPTPDRALWTAELDGAGQLRLTVAQRQIPIEQLDIAIDAAVQTGRQGGRFLVTVINPLDENAFEASVEFLQNWLPDGDDRSVVLSGELNEDIVSTARALLGPLQGTGIENTVAPRPALARLESPEMGSREQLAFLLFVGVLQQRLNGYDPQIRWDHRATTSQVLINRTLRPELFEPVFSEELEPVQAAYTSSAQQRERNAEQIHRYLVTSAVYGLPADFLVSQQQLLAAITLDDVNAVREQSLAEQFPKAP